MRKSLARIMAVLCTMTVCAPLAACGGGVAPNLNNSERVEIDKSKAQLHVSNFNGGVGHDWLDAHIKRFEEVYAEHEFIPGTKGVQVHVNNHKSGIEGLSGQMKNAPETVYFLEDVNYYDAISLGLFMDITDVVTGDLAAYGEEGVTIESKLYESQVEFYKTSNGKYYGLPHAQSPTMITYDGDLFDTYGLYFGENGVIGKKSTDSGLSKGVDNVAGTYDDGLPATYEQFFQLCATMKQRGISPLVWSGMYPWYTTRFAKTLRADFDGAEAMTAYNFNGTMTHLVDTIDENGNITYRAPVAVTVDNGYEVFNSASYYYSFKFLEDVYKNNYYDSNSFNKNISHMDAQSLLLYNVKKTTGKIGMLVEGLYWVNEAKATFKELSNIPNSQLKDRNLKVMPMPKATADQVGQQSTIVDSLNQLAFISAYTPAEKVELSKTFLQFCTTQASLEEFVTETGLTRNYKVDYSGIYNNLSPYSKSVIDVLSDCNYIMPASEEVVFQKNYDAFCGDGELVNVVDQDPITLIKEGKSAYQIFNNYTRAKYNATNWKNLLS